MKYIVEYMMRASTEVEADDEEAARTAVEDMAIDDLFGGEALTICSITEEENA